MIAHELLVPLQLNKIVFCNAEVRYFHSEMPARRTYYVPWQAGSMEYNIIF
jgi:hypothetical protein